MAFISNRSPDRDLFIIWARCKWDSKVRGFLIEKVSPMRIFILRLRLMFYLP